MNNIDGIQKMSADELKRKREIILGMLGEDFNAPKSTNKKVDGILFEKKTSVESVSREMVVAAEKKHAEEQQKQWQEELRKNTLVGKNVLDKMITDKKNIQTKKNSFSSPEPEIKTIKKQPSNKVNTTIRKKLILSKSIKKTATKIKQKVFFRNKLGKPVFSFTIVKLKKNLEKFSFISLTTILALSVFYLSFSLLVVINKIDNGFSRFWAKFLPVPAMVVDNRFIDFYDYVDLKNKLNGDDIKTRKELIKNVLTRNFFNKYGNNEGATSEVINSTSLNRVRKIKMLINKDGDFDQIAGRYGDKRESINLSNDDFAKYEYGDKIKNLNVGEVSNIIIVQDGYYLFKCFKKDGANTSLSYIFVQAKNFDQYVEETAKNIYYVSFID